MLKLKQPVKYSVILAGLFLTYLLALSCRRTRLCPIKPVVYVEYEMGDQRALSHTTVTVYYGNQTVMSDIIVKDTGKVYKRRYVLDIAIPRGSVIDVTYQFTAIDKSYKQIDQKIKIN